MKETPELSDRQIAAGLGVTNKTVAVQRKELERAAEIPQLDSSIGADGKEYPRQAQRKPIAVYNPTPREEQALKNPAILDKLSGGTAKSVPDALREVKREELKANLESVEVIEAKAVQGVNRKIVVTWQWLPHLLIECKYT